MCTREFAMRSAVEQYTSLHKLHSIRVTKTRGGGDVVFVLGVSHTVSAPDGSSMPGACVPTVSLARGGEGSFFLQPRGGRGGVGRGYKTGGGQGADQWRQAELGMGWPWGRGI